MKFRRWLSKNLLGIEHRSGLGESYSSYSSWLLSQAAGGSTITASDVRKSAVIEAASSLFGRALSQAVVEPSDDARTSPITADFLLGIGRQLIRSGQALFEIRLKGGEVELVPAEDWEVRGDSPDPKKWRVRISQATPSGPIITKDISYLATLHFKYASSLNRPWVGIPPWEFAADSATLLAGLERRLGEESSCISAILLAVPSGIDSGSDNDSDALASLRADIGKSKGQPMLIETTAGGFEQGSAAAPRTDWRPQRLGASPPRELLELRRDCERSLLAACGVPPGLFGDRVASTSQQSWRRFLHSSLLPFAKRVQAELSEKLDLDVRLDLSHLLASDVLPATRALKTLTEAGVPLDEAKRIAGLDA